MKIKKVIFDMSRQEYLTNTLATEFTKKISEAKDFSWLGFLEKLYLYSLNGKFKDRCFISKKAINSKVDIRVDLKQ